MNTADDRRRAAKAALDRGNALFHSPSWRSSVTEYETALRLYTDPDDVGGQADVAGARSTATPARSGRRS